MPPEIAVLLSVYLHGCCASLLDMRTTRAHSSWRDTDASFIRGSVCWIEVSSTDPAGSRDSYAGLFGWTYQIDPGRGQHTTALSAGWPVAGLAGGPAQPGQLVTWTVYLMR